tara:strand:+ start:147387 stop:148223 length:837 start_codon:yes stop_codon:yes gene_type:complete
MYKCTSYLIFGLFFSILIFSCKEDEIVETDQDDELENETDIDPFESVREVAGAVDCIPTEVIFKEISLENDTSVYTDSLVFNDLNLLTEYYHTSRQTIYYYSYDSMGRIRKIETVGYSEGERETDLEIEYSEGKISSGILYNREMDNELLQILNSGSGSYNLVENFTLEFEDELLKKIVTLAYTDYFTYLDGRPNNQNSEFILAAFSDRDIYYTMLMDSRLANLSERVLKDGTPYLEVYHEYSINEAGYITEYIQQWYSLEEEESLKTLIIDLAYSCE